MTDYEEFRTFLNLFGIAYRVEQREGEQIIVCTAKTEKVDGYYGFFVDFTFDQTGEFVTMGVWE